MIEIFIPFNTPSSKNSKQWTGKFLTSSKNTHLWRKNTKVYWEKFKADFLQQVDGLPLNTPILVGMHFVRKSKHKFDFNNVTQTIQDEMVTHGWLSDDNCDIMLPLPLFINNSCYTHDKLNPGVYIKVISMNPNNNIVSLTL